MEIPLKVKAWLAARWAALGAWLMRKWLLVFAAALALLAFLVVFSGKKSQDTVEDAAQATVLSKKQVRHAEKVIAQKLDSIKVQTIIIEKIVHERDSAVVVARRHEARADSTLKTLRHETLPDEDLAPASVYNRLAAYRPRAVALPGGDSLR